MFKDLFRKAPGEPAQEQTPGDGSRRTYQAGWLFGQDKTSVIWDAPQPIRAEPPQTSAAKSVAFCPAVIEFDRRHFVINSPVDMHIRLSVGQGGQLQVTNVLSDRSPVRQGTLGQMMVVMPANEWRHPQRPVVQIATPYIFVSDDPLYINQFPPFLHYGAAQIPGVQLCGRYPIDIWPRPLMWAMEWHDMSKELVLKRGQPWFYVRFEGPDPSAQVRLVEAERTSELESHVASITDVTNYVNQSFSLFKTARERRPETLLVPKKR
jgi:hypothetical protein